MNVYLVAAAVVCLLIWAAHTFLGSPEIAGPLLRADMPPVPKLTNYYCWHLVTIVLLAMSGGFLYAALVPSGRDVAWIMTALSAAFCVWGFALVVWKRQRSAHMPQWIFFAVLTAVAVPGLVS